MAVLRPEDWPVVPGYKLVQEIGGGGYGVIFLAEETSLLQKKCAVKVCWPSPLQSQGSVKDRFYRESKTLSELNHPRVVPYIHSGFTEVGEGTEPRPFIVMGLIEGEDLRKQSGHSVERACEVILSVLETLQYCHDRGVIHRDLKPGNIIVRQVDAAPVLVDFGLSISLASIGERVSKEAVGSPGYMAPELIADPLLLDVRLDVFSMGIVLYELIAGKLPNVSDPMPLTEVHPELDGHLRYLDEIIRTCLAIPASRYPSANAFKEKLAAWLDVYQERLKSAGRLSSRGQTLLRGLLEEKRRREMDRRASTQTGAEMVRLAEKQATSLMTKVLLVFEEVVSAIKGDIPDVAITKGTALHSTPGSRLIASTLDDEKVHELVTLSAAGQKLSFGAVKFSKAEHPWLKEPLFAAGPAEGVILDLRRGGPLSPRVMQPLLIMFSQEDAEAQKAWLHLAIAIVFEEAERVDISGLKLVVEHHPKFTGEPCTIVLRSTPEEVEEDLWKVLNAFISNELAAKL